MFRTLTRLAVLAAFVLTASVPGQWQRHWFGEAVALTIDDTQIAILVDDENLALRSLALAGVDVERLVRWPISGWFLASTPPAARGEIAEFVTAISRADGIAFATPVFAGHEGGPLWPTPTLLVRGIEGYRAEVVDALIERSPLAEIIEHDWGGLPRCRRIALASRSGIEVLDLANSLARRREIDFSEPDWIFTGRKDSLPTDAYFGQQWFLEYALPAALASSDLDTDAPEAWEITNGNGGVVIAIIDDGMQYDHPDLPYGIRGYDTTTGVGGDGTAQVLWDNHGTVTAGVIAATSNNGHGVTGLVPEVSMLSVRCYVSFSYYGFTAMTSWTVPALDWAWNEGADITNNSVTLGVMDSALTAKYDQMRQAGVLHYASSGNDPLIGTSWPANLASVHGVVGINFVGELTSFSSYGANMSYAGPAQFVYSTDRTGTFGFNSNTDYVPGAGTTFSGAYGSAHGAVALSVNPALSADDVDAILAMTCTDLGAAGFDPYFANGLLNSYAIAWQAALTLPDPRTRIFRQNAPAVDDGYGAAVIGLGDVDADGTNDFAVGLPRDDIGGPDGGRIEVRSGATGLVLYDVVGAASEGIGARLFAVGDLDGDGIRDFADTDPLADPGGLIDAGRVRLHSGLNGTAILQFFGTAAGQQLGAAVAELDDIDDDGTNEFGVGSPGATVGGNANVGQIEIRSGASRALLTSISGSYAAGDREFGSAIARCPDQDGDLEDDVLVGIPGFALPGPNTGRMAVVSSATGSQLSTFASVEPGARFGSAVAAWIDLDDDGSVELVGTAPASDAYATDCGSAVVYSPNLGVPVAGWAALTAQARFGSSLAISPDIDGDGFDDLLIGVPGDAAVGTGAGAIHVYSKFWPRARYVLRGGAAGDAFGAAAAPLGDVDGDGRAEIVVAAAGTGATGVDGWTAILPAAPPARRLALPASSAGNVVAPTGGNYDLLLINGSGGYPDRRVEVGINEDVRVSLLPTVDATTPTYFAIWAYLGVPSAAEELPLPAAIGNLLFTPCSIGGAGSLLITNNIAPDSCPEFVTSSPAPWHVTAAGGLPIPYTLTYQGIVLVDGALHATNAVVLDIE